MDSCAVLFPRATFRTNIICQFPPAVGSYREHSPQAGEWMRSITGWWTRCFRAVECDGIRNRSENIMSSAAAALGVGWQSQGRVLSLQSSPVFVGWRKASGCCSPGGHWRLHPAPSSSRGHQQQGCEPGPSPLQWARVWGREHLHWQAHTWDPL